jgi:hypothetical protein
LRRRVRRPRRSVSRRSAQSSGGLYAKVIMAVLVIGICVYIVTAGFAGKWVAENIVSPVISFFQDKPAPSLAPPIQDGDDGIEPSPSATQSISKNVVTNAFTGYMLQVGVFSSKTNAETYAAEIKIWGGAGYVYEDSGSHRVFAAAYNDENDAKTVGQKLTDAAGLEYNVFKLDVSKIDMDITAGSEQAQAIEQAFECHVDVIKKLGDGILAFDNGNQNMEATKQSLTSLASELNTARRRLSSISNQTLSGLEELMITFLNDIEQLAGREYVGETAFSSDVKHVHITSIIKYDDFVNRLVSGS